MTEQLGHTTRGTQSFLRVSGTLSEMASVHPIAALNIWKAQYSMGTGFPASLFKKADLLYGIYPILPKASDTDLVREPLLSPRMALQSLA